MNSDKNIICLKYGNKYPAHYVNRLYNMVRRNITGNFNFYCITEDPAGLDSHINSIHLPKINDLKGWWYKPFVFSKDLPIKGKLLFLDLDIVIIKNIDCFFDYEPKKFCIIRDFTRTTQPNWQRYNSSIFRLETGTLSHVWDSLIKDTNIVRRLHGDQDWLYHNIKENVSFWPDEWCQSYKWEVRNQEEVVGVGSKKSFSSILIDPDINPKTNILVFHGYPKPDQVQDPVIVDNWR
jgi:hypothetical protein